MKGHENMETTYIIANETQYITHAKSSSSVSSIQTTTNQACATTFSYKKACNTLASLPKRLRMLSDAWEIKPSTLLEHRTTCQKSISSTLKSIPSPSCSHTYNFGSDDFDWMSIGIKLDSIKPEAVAYRTILNEKLSYVDKEIADIQHYIEFSSLDAYKGYKCYKLLQECLQDRRNIKLEIERISIILEAIKREKAQKSVTDALREIDRKRYAPRILVGLFENGI